MSNSESLSLANIWQLINELKFTSWIFDDRFESYEESFKIIIDIYDYFQKAFLYSYFENNQTLSDEIYLQYLNDFLQTNS
jgi:phosphatidylserine decarboxylase